MNEGLKEDKEKTVFRVLKEMRIYKERKPRVSAMKRDHIEEMLKTNPTESGNLKVNSVITIEILRRDFQTWCLNSLTLLPSKVEIYISLNLSALCDLLTDRICQC